MRARIRRFRRERKRKDQRWVREFLTTNRGFRRYVLGELERNGPMLSRDFEDRAKGERDRDSRWWGPRLVGLMLLSLHLYGEITIVGRQGGERLWDLTERWWPETATVTIRCRRPDPGGAALPQPGRPAPEGRVGDPPGRGGRARA